MRKALIIGINHYKYVSPLFGCVNDAQNVESVLKSHYDGTKNFDVLLKTAKSSSSIISRKELKNAIQELFRDDNDIALFYFAGHGYVESTGGYLLTSECDKGDDGLAINDLMEIANTSRAKNKIILLDCCHSGIIGNRTPSESKSELVSGLTILTASGANEYAAEDNSSGVFTNLLVDALKGGAANLMGEVSPGSIYAHIDQSLGAWAGQRPIFKTNIKSFISLRKVQPSISLDDLKQIIVLFEKKEDTFQLNPTFEPERTDEQSKKYPDPIEANNQKFKILQKYNRVNLLVPIDAPHMWHAAMESKSCQLTALGKHYWSLVKKNRI
jgi:hypothetical protein